VSRSVRDRIIDALHAVDRARDANLRLGDAEINEDLIGVQIAFDAILFNLFVLGEAVKFLPEHLLSAEDGIDWRAIAGMRDVIGHQYHRIVPSIIERVVIHELEPVSQALRSFLDGSASDETSAPVTPQ